MPRPTAHRCADGITPPVHTAPAPAQAGHPPVRRAPAAGRATRALVAEVAQPVVARVTGSFMGLDPADDKPWATAINTLMGFGDPDLNPKGLEQLMTEDLPPMYEKCMALVADRRANPGEDMLSVLVFAEIDGDTLSDEEIFSGFILLMAAGNDSTKATYTSTMRALMEHTDQRQLLLDDPSLVPAAVEEAPRVFPA